MCILSEYALLNVVGYYDLSVLFMSVMGFPKKKFGWRVGGVSSIQLCWMFGICLTLQAPTKDRATRRTPDRTRQVHYWWTGQDNA